jgi:methionyl-tRNA synthetase
VRTSSQGEATQSVQRIADRNRYNKARGRPTLYVCGTDEYGTATETKALEEKVTPEELCAKYYKIHAEVYEWFEIGFDIFGRTPTKHHTQIAQDVFLKLYKNNLLTEKTNEQPYCDSHHSFLADRFVEGECPICHYEDARGDQCDKCGNLLDPLNLINPKCKVDGATPVVRETTHIHLKLEELQPRIEEWTVSSIKKGAWSRNAAIITESWLKTGLKDRGITRDLKWGVPVPLPGFEKKVLYVWFEACIGYPSITANYTPEWKQWWLNPEQVKLYQFLGKDNVPFHSVIFPGCQLGSGDNWTMLHHLSATEYLNYENGKFSKSRGIGVFGNNAKETGIPPDVWRYYLLKNRPESGDTQFEWGSFIESNNSELLAKLGNFVNRVVKLVNSPKAYSGTIPQFDVSKLPASIEEPLSEVTALLKQYLAEMEAVKLRAGLLTAMKVAEAGNGLIQSHRLDNALIASDPSLASAVVGTVVNLIYLCSAIFEPYLPATCVSIRKQLDAPFLNIPSEEDIEHGWRPTYLFTGHKIGKAEYLFTRIDEKKAEEWREMFGGTQEGRRQKEEEAAKIAQQKAEKKQKAKEKKAEKKSAQGGEKGNTATHRKENGDVNAAAGVESTAKGGKDRKVSKAKVSEDVAVDKVVDGVAQVTIPTS